MTLEEAGELKPGDKVLVEATVHSQMGDFAIFRVQTDCFPFVDMARVSYDKIRKRLPQPRRKFRRGDIVSTRLGNVFFVVDDESDDGKVGAEPNEGWLAEHFAEAESLTLICALENRMDRKVVING